MTRVAANQIVFVLASIGVFIALVTGIAHASGVQLPCGGVQSGCNVIAQPENSQWFGVPIAFYGLAAYMFVALFALFRGAIGLEQSPKLGMGMWVLLGCGALISVGLVTHAYTGLHASCIWCLASTVTIVAAFLVHSYGSGQAKAGGKQWPFASFMAILSAAAIGGAAYGFSLRLDVPQAQTMMQDIPAYEDSDIFLGKADAPVAVTEFTDLYCPTCRSQHAWLMQQVGPMIEAGKVKLVVRHYPLPDLHPLAVKAAMFAIWAQEEGKFWEFMDAVHQIQDSASEAALLSAVDSVGLEAAQAGAILEDTTRRQTLQKDIDDAAKLHVDSTPTWVVDYPDGSRQMTIASGIQRLVADVHFKKFTK
jgi:protein-disulfide isomerase/uncharacterized membrane protein